jgi:UDP-glucose:(heptosyl)LPS alpha-1,3-glucosyltransferase
VNPFPAEESYRLLSRHAAAADFVPAGRREGPREADEPEAGSEREHPLRIAYVYRDFNREGSIPSFFVERAERLAQFEEVTAVCSAATRQPTTAPVSFATVEPLIRGRGRLSYAVECGSFALRATRYLRANRSRFDVVHVDGFAALDADLVTVHAVRPAEIDEYFTYIEPKAVVRRRGTPFLRPQSGVVMAIERQLFRPPYPICLPLSRAIAADLRRVYGVPDELIQVQPYGIDLAMFRFDGDVRSKLRARLAIPAERIVVLFVGDDFKRKGLRVAIEAVARVRQDVELWVAGRGDRDAHESMAASLGVANRVRFLDRLTRGQIIETLSAADALVLPSRQDVWGNPVLEAMAMGRVPIVSERTGASELIVPGENGFVLSGSGSAEEISAVIDGALSSPDVRERIGRRARETACEYDLKALWQGFHDAHKRAHARRLELNRVTGAKV